MNQHDLATIFSPLEPAFVADPYPYYSTLREHDPVHKSHMGYWVLTRYEDIVNALKDTRLSNEPSPIAVVNRRNREKYTAADVASNIIPFMDPPRHTSSRKLISRAFHEHLNNTPPNIQLLTNQILDRHKERGEIDIIGDLGTPLSVSIIAQLLGIPEKDNAQLKEWSGWFFYLFSVIPTNEVLNNMNKALDEFRSYLLHFIKQRQQTPGNDLISKLIHAGDETEKLSVPEVIDTCMLLVSDAIQNVDRGIGNSIACLLKHPEQMQQLKEQRSLIKNAVNECLRYEAPGQFIAKIAREDIEIHGKTIRKHDAVLLILASANRDPDYFSHADQFDITRTNTPHLSLGKGRHSCIGAPLVNMETQIAVNSALEIFDNLQFKESRLEWEPRFGHRWLKRLPVTFKPY